MNVVYIVLILLTSTASVIANTTTNLIVTANVPKIVRVETEDLNFGSYSYFNNQDTETMTIVRVFVTRGDKFSIGLDSGKHSSMAHERKMKKISIKKSYLLYKLCKDQACSTILGDGTNGANPFKSLTGSGLNTPIEKVIYGKINKNQGVAPGYYRDVVNVKVVFD